MFMNYLKLEIDKPVRVHFDDYHLVQRTIFDPELQKDVYKWTHMFWIDRIDGEPAAKSFSVLAEGLWQQLEPYVKNDTFREYEWIISKTGEGRQTKYTVEKIPTAKYTSKQYFGHL